jgi:hypothetical protein
MIALLPLAGCSTLLPDRPYLAESRDCPGRTPAK